MAIYGTSVIPSDSVEVVSGGTVSISLGFNATVGIVGGMDTGSGTATEGTVYEVSSVSDAQDKFGDGSELHSAVELAYANGVATVYAVGVSETSVTGEDPSSGTAGELDNAPVFDPNVNTEHDITDQNSNTINISYDPGSETVTGTEAYVNPVTGDFNGDGGTTYLLDYDYGDYDAAVQSIISEDLRFLVVLTENESVVSSALTDVKAEATDFRFMRVVAGAAPVPDPESTSSYVTGYSDSVDDQRAVLTAASRGYNDDAQSTQVRTASAVGGLLTGKDLGASTTGSSRGQLSGLTGLRAEFSNADLGNLIDEQVLPLKDGSTLHVVKDMTTSTDAKFERVYAVEIVDEVATLSHEISQTFVGALNFDENRESLRNSHITAYQDMADDRPPLLNDPDGTQPYAVNVSTGATATEVDVEIGVDVVDVMDTIDVTVTVGDVVVNQGAV